MQTHWLRRSGGGRLVIFVLGWAADWRVIGRIPGGADVLAVYDFRRIEPLIIPSYSEVYLFAWSFGVRVAEEIFGEFSPCYSVALNGTPRPVDEKFGIEPRRMATTLRGLEKGGMEAFERKAYGGYYEDMKSVLSPRRVDDNILELRSLCAISESITSSSFHWDKAIIGVDDLIFSPENQLAYWGSRAELLPLPHYPFGDAQLIEREIGSR